MECVICLAVLLRHPHPCPSLPWSVQTERITFHPRNADYNPPIVMMRTLLTWVTLVQLSGQVWSPHTPSLIMGSIVKQWPGFITPTALFLA